MIDQIRARLLSYVPLEIEPEGRARAAVLIPLYSNGDSLHVILTKRTNRVEHHKGEISFPGGARDPEDADLVATALRESDEEIGLDARHVEVVGRIDDHITVSQFHVTAYVGALDPRLSPYAWRPHAAEVAVVLEVPIEHLLDPSNLVPDPRAPSGRAGQMQSFRFGEHVIFGATARMLHNFLDIAARGQVGRA